MPVLAAAFLLALGLTMSAAHAQTSCAGRTDVLGIERILAIDAATTPRVGRKSFPQTLPLAPREVVLTFDDGPRPGTTPRVLDALKAECTRATFFLLGRNAVDHPNLARREIVEGHTVGSHTFSHPPLDRMSFAAAVAEIDHGFSGVETALYSQSSQTPRTPFFRFPGFASTPELLDYLEKRGIVVFGADLWASDWNPQSPDQQLQLVLRRLEALRGGIVLFHDTRAQTASMLPEFLRALKNGGYKVVHVVPARRSASQSPPPVIFR
jgi:peptidoglycan-N-acetylglucosamine deacetylase